MPNHDQNILMCCDIVFVGSETSCTEIIDINEIQGKVAPIKDGSSNLKYKRDTQLKCLETVKIVVLYYC